MQRKWKAWKERIKNKKKEENENPRRARFV